MTTISTGPSVPQPSATTQTFEVFMPAGVNKDPDKAALFMRELGRLARGKLQLILAIQDEKLHWKIAVESGIIRAEDLESMVKSHYPSASVDEVESPNTEGYLPLVLYRKTDKWFDPIAVQSDYTHLPLASLAQLLNEGDKRQCSIQIVIALGGNYDDKKGVKAALVEVKSGLSRNGRTGRRIGLVVLSLFLITIGAVVAVFTGGIALLFFPFLLPLLPFNQKQGPWQLLQKAKVNNPDKYATTIGIFVKSAAPEMTNSWADYVGQRICLLYGAKLIAANKPTPTEWGVVPATGNLPVDPKTLPKWMTADIYTHAELATFWHMPTHEFGEELLGTMKEAKPSKELLDNTEGVVIGTFKNNPIRVPYGNRTTHINIVGRAGTGKSRLMGNLIRQDLESGKGVCVIDPHGTLVSEVLENGIPSNRIGDVVIYDLADLESPIWASPEKVET